MLKVGLGDIDVSACVEASLKAALLLEFLCGNNTVTTRNSRKNKADDRLNKEVRNWLLLTNAFIAIVQYDVL